MAGIDSRIATYIQMVAAVFQRPSTSGRKPLFLKYIPLPAQLSHRWTWAMLFFVDDLEAVLEQFRLIANDLGKEAQLGSIHC
jgi:hypothetical protein